MLSVFLLICQFFISILFDGTLVNPIGVAYFFLIFTAVRKILCICLAFSLYGSDYNNVLTLSHFRINLDDMLLLT